MAHVLEDRPRTKDILVKEDFTFNSLFLSNKILQGLNDSGFYRPSPIQLKAIPLGRCGLDLIVKAKSGTGKTLVFTVLALETVKVTSPFPQVIIVAPTREIAVQIKDVTESLGKQVDGLKVAYFIGGLPLENDVKKIQKCHVVIGAPGRIKSLIEKQALQTKGVRLLVFDEADKLMEECFQSDVNYIYNSLPERKQVLAVSATYPNELNKFIANYMQTPTFVTPEVDSSVLLGLKQFVSVVKEHKNIMNQITIKTDELVRLLSQISFSQCIVFFNFQTRAETLSHILKQRGWNAMYISGSQPQTERLKVMNSLKKFECRILLTTDLTARGIDASNVDFVINYEVPFKAATYLHRMGRAGRYGSCGLCVTIANEGMELYNLQRILGQIGGSELNVAKIPEALDSIWTCPTNNLEKIESVIDTDEHLDIKKAVVDLKYVNKNLQDLNIGDKDVEVKKNDSSQNKEESLDLETDESIMVKDSEDVAHEKKDDNLISASVLYPWIPIAESILSKMTGENLLEDAVDTSETTKKRKISNDSKLTLSKNMALYDSAQLLTSNNLQLSEHLSESVGNYFNELREEDKRREEEMDKFFEGYSCDDILNNLAEHTEAWSNAECDVDTAPVDVPLKLSNKENLFNIAYDFMVKNNRMHWTETLSDYASTDDEKDDTIDETEDGLVTEEIDNYEFNNSVWDITNNYASNSVVSQNPYADISTFKELYDNCSQDMYNYAGAFTDEASANAWYDSWRQKLSSITNYVQQNIETYEKSRYQHSVYFNSK